jgi:L-gulono-1,4-lactone dehydrogenase
MPPISRLPSGSISSMPSATALSPVAPSGTPPDLTGIGVEDRFTVGPPVASGSGSALEQAGVPRQGRRAELAAASFTPPSTPWTLKAGLPTLPTARGLLTATSVSTVSTLASALKAAMSSTPRGVLTTIHRRGEGFEVVAYAGAAAARTRLQDVQPSSLPLGAALGAPQTWVVDGQGAVGQLVRLVDGRLALDDVNPRFLTEPKAAAALGAGLPAVVPTPQTNHSKNVQFTPAVAFRPSADLGELSRIVRFVHEHLPAGTKIKAGGSLHAYSDVAATSAVFIHPEQMKGIRALPAVGAVDDTVRADVDRRHLVEVVGGTTIAELNRDLWARGLSIPNLGGYDGQTVAGVLATGTHGSVLSRGPLFEMVEATTLVRADGSVVRIEPKDGLSDPVAFAAKHPDIELLQDDDAFAACLLHNGALGVVHSHVLKVTDAFHLEEARTLSDVDTVKGLLKDGGVHGLFGDLSASPSASAPSPLPGHPAKNFHLEFWFNVHSDTVVVTSRNKVKLEQEPFDLHDRPGRDLLEVLRMGGTWTRPALPTWLTENAATLVGGATSTVARLVPKATPWLIDQAMKILPDERYVQRSYNVFNIGDGANAIPALASTIFVPLRDDLYLQAIDVFRETAARFAADDKYQTGPLSLRFVKGSEAALGIGEDVASFEIIFAEGTPHAAEMTAAYYEALRARLGDDVTYHWGQFSPGLSAEAVASSFPRSDTFQKLRRSFDPTNRFLNDTQERLFG